MFDKILPRSIDNVYQGHKLGLGLFAVVVAIRMTQSLMIIFNGYTVAMGADGIPLNTFTPQAAQTVVTMFALSAVSRLIIALLCLLTLVRYRSAVPLMFVVLILAYLAGELVLWFLPLARTGAPPGPGVNVVSFAVMVFGLVLSLWKRKASAHG